MPPKKQKPNGDIRSFFNKETVSPDDSSSTKNTQTVEPSTFQMAAAREVKVKMEEEEKKKKKEEDDINSKGQHSNQRRQLKVTFPKKEGPYKIDCDQACTVLDAIKSRLPNQFQKMRDKMKDYSDSKIIIQRSNNSIIATHFPCSCLDDEEHLTIICKGKELEKIKSQPDEILARDEYSVFYISKAVGENMTATDLLRTSPGPNIDYVCVYAKKGTLVEEALKRDGRFVDLQDFKLFGAETAKEYILCTETVDNLDQKKFKICRERRSANYANKQASSEQQKQQKVDTKSVLDAAKKSEISVKRAMEETNSKVNTKEIYKLLCEQFKKLKEWMDSRFPGDSYQKALELKKENFGKIQKSFSEVHRVKKLLKLGESVCKVIVKGVCQGTGFVLFDRLILTNAHLFEKCVEENKQNIKCVKEYKLQEGTDVYVLFNYDEPEPFTNYNMFTAEKTFIDFDLELDYAILELNLEAEKPKQTAETEETKVPPGLLSKFGPPPVNGEACLIGHPAGEVKQMDPTCIIAKKDREQAVNQNLEEYRDYIFTLYAINQEIRKDPYADIYVTYNSFMYHGSSGSPVFDTHGQVVGLHSGGFFFGFVKPNESVIEFAVPLLTIFENFVSKLKESGKTKLLERVQKVVNGNSDLEKIIESVVGPRQTGHEGQLREIQEESQESESLTEGLNDEEEMEIN